MSTLMPGTGGDEGIAAERRKRPLFFANSTAALESARRRNLVALDDEVRTFSPAMRSQPGMVAADGAMTPERIADLEAVMLRCSRALFDAFLEQDRAEATVLARAVISELPAVAFHALALSEGDLDRPIGVIGVEFSDRRSHMFLGSPLEGLRAGGLHVETHKVPEAQVPVPEAIRPIIAPFSTRLSHASLSSVGYRMSSMIWEAAGLRGPRGTILVVRENELLKEAGFALSLMGYAVRKLRYPDIDDTSAASVAPRSTALIREVIGPKLMDVLPPRIANVVAEAVASRAALAVGRFRVLRRLLSEELAKQSALRPQAVLTNVKFEPEAVAIRCAARDAGIPSFCFAHGFAAEFSARERNYCARHENVLAETAVVFTHTAKAILDQNPLRAGTTVAVGLPDEYLRRRRRKTSGGTTAPIWYVSTALYNGSNAALCVGVSDGTLAERETGLIREVLARLTHRVLYKPYPARRYLDLDPVVETAKRTPSINVRSDGIDLRYIAHEAGVLVTARATSTVYWCLVSGRPVVFIDHADELPLAEDARGAFREGLFLFETRNADWKDALTAFLSQPIAVIEQQWAAKAQARTRLITEYFSCVTSGGAGRRAARIISQRISGQTPHSETLVP